MPVSNLSTTEAAAAEQPPARAAHPYRAFILRIGLGAAIVAFLLWHYDARPALHTLGSLKVSDDTAKRLEKLALHPDVDRARFVIEMLGRRGGHEAAATAVARCPAGSCRSDF